MAAPMELWWRHFHTNTSPCLTFLRQLSSRKKTSPSIHSASSDFSLHIRKQYLQAKRSVLVRTQNPGSSIKALQKYDRLNAAFFTSSGQGYILAEFSNEVAVQQLLDDTSYFVNPEQFHLRSRCICDLYSSDRHGSRHKSKPVKIGLYPDRSNLKSEYPALGSLEAELVHLHQQRSLNDLDLRMRFMMCVLIEDVVRALAPDMRIVPFGSCLNGFGWWGSDLDMMLCFHNDPFQMSPGEKQGTDMKYLTEFFRSDRHLAHHTLTMVSSLLALMPRTTRVTKILHAKVPIIKFKHILLNLECDMSLQAIDSIRMTELLYLLSTYEERLKLLMTAVKEWAVAHDQTSSGEKQKPTTIGLLFLLIFYLQTRSSPVLPTLRQVQASAGSSNEFLIEGVKYKLPLSQKFIPRSMNNESLGSLLQGFFQFYSTFDFETQGIAVADGKSFTKTVDSSPLLIENPLCIGMNICKNVSLGRLQSLQESMGQAARTLESLQNNGSACTAWLSPLMSQGQQPTDDNVDVEIESILSDFTDAAENKQDAHR